MSGHLDVLRALNPLPIGGDDPIVDEVEAEFLDEAAAYLEEIEAEIWPSTASSLSRWEAIYGLSGSGTDSDRRLAILAAMNASGGISKAFFEALANSMGFVIRIDRGVYPFRSGVSAAGDSVREVNFSGVPDPPGWDPLLQGPYPADLFIWTVSIDSLGQNQNSDSLKSAFLRLRPAFTSILWAESGSSTLLGAS